jgi:hypothetical protein
LLIGIAFLLQHDNDSFNRWEAGQQLTASIIFELVSAIKQGKSLAIADILVDSFKVILFILRLPIAAEFNSPVSFWWFCMYRAVICSVNCSARLRLTVCLAR